MDKPIPYVEDNPGLWYSGHELTRPLKVGTLKALVVGTGRCGTVYLAKLLSSAGLPCGHESVFRVDGLGAALTRMRGEEEVGVSLISKLASISDEEKGKNWFGGVDRIEADSSYLAAPHLGVDELRGVKVIHVVRNPLQVINSFVVGFKYFRDDWKDNEAHRAYHEYIYSHLKGVEEAPDPISRAARYVVGWNGMIEAGASGREYIRHRVESSPRRLLTRLGLKSDVLYDNKECNRRIDMPTFIKKYSDIPDREAAEMVESMSYRYGYGKPRLL